MNKPARPPVPEADLGPLDADGQQVWSPEEQAAIARVLADPDRKRSIAEARADAADGHGRSPDEVVDGLAELKRRWLADRGR